MDLAGRENTTSILPDLKSNVEWIKDTLGHSADLIIRPIPYQNDTQAVVLFINGLVDERAIRKHIITPLVEHNWQGTIGLEIIDLLTQEEIVRSASLEDLANSLLGGNTVLLAAGEPTGYTIATPGWSLRPILEPRTQKVIRGPRESFTETLEENIAMVRRWIKDPKLRVRKIRIGARTRTEVAILYIEDLAHPEIVTEVWKRLEPIDIDGVLDSGYLEQLIKDKRYTLFPLTQNTERSDTVASGILEGRVAILTDKSPSGIIVPTTVNELYQSAEDYYFDFWLGSFLRLIRLLGNNLAIALPGLYVALVVVNTELLPTKLALNIAASRMGVPFPLVGEVLLIELTIEVFREASLRLPSTVASTLGVVTGVVLGFAAVQIGLVSNATLIVSIITAIASFSGPDYAVGISWRLLKFFLIIGASFMGLWGLSIFGLYIISHMATLESFGVSYLAPWAPLQPMALMDGPFRSPLWLRFYRPKTYRPQDKDRSGGTRKEQKE
ncbi:MAG TPA: spore germination protein [Bacillota bacterium]|nr:spore germination protein [Bacillota bacterium]